MAAAQEQAASRQAADGFAGKVLSWSGAYLIAFIGLTHLLASQEHFGYAPYLGLLFLANFLGATVAAGVIARDGKKWAWLLGDLIAVGSLAGLILSLTLGLPGYPEGVGRWFNFPAWISILLVLAYLPLSLLALTSRGGSLVRVEEKRIQRERVPPEHQETPQHFGLVEQYMREIRTRMTPDLLDMKAHVQPRAMGERFKRRVRGRLREAAHRALGKG